MYETLISISISHTRQRTGSAIKSVEFFFTPRLLLTKNKVSAKLN